MQTFNGHRAVQAFSSLPGRRLAHAVCVIRRHPFEPLDKETHVIERPLKLATVARRHGIDPKREPIICRVNGRLVSQRDWKTTWVTRGQIAEFVVLPRGGDTGRTVLAVALTIAVVAAAFFAGPAVATALGATGIWATIVSSVVSAAIVAGGSLLINAVIPPANQALADPTTGNAGLAASSPTYSLGAQSNQARLGQPIPVMYGRHLIFPDYAASPWAAFAAQKQYLYQIFCLGQGEFDIEQIRLSEANIENFLEIDYEVVGPGDSVTLFETNIYQSREAGGQTLFGTSEDEHDWVGPFPACPPQTTIDHIFLDFIFPQGLYKTDPDTGDIDEVSVSITIEARTIDDLGAPVGAFVEIDSFNFEEAKTNVRRYTREYDLPSPDRWEVRVQRTDDEINDSKGRDQVVWAGLKGRLPETATFGDVTVIAVKARASDSLNSNTSHQFNVIATRKLPIWDGVSWSAPTATQSIAWAAADVLRNTTYGAGLPDENIDLAGLLALDATWEERGDEFNAVFDQGSTNWDALTKILRAGRARPFQQSSLVRFYRDELREVPVAMFSLANIALDSFSLSFLFPIEGEAADGVTADFFDERTWRPATITIGIDDVEPEDPAHEQLFGVTLVQQAENEAAYMAAANRYRRVFTTFTTELEGMIPSVGDLITVAHDIPQWGVSGNVTRFDTDTLALFIDQDVNVEAGDVIILRDAEGVPSAQILVSQGTEAGELILAESPTYPDDSPFTIVFGDAGGEPSHYAVGKVDDEPRHMIVTNIAPRGNYSVEISAVLEDVRVHVN